MITRRYIVYHKRGRLDVLVDENILLRRGERTVVAEAAWRKLLGVNMLGEDIDKKSPTRAIIREEIASRYQHQRGDVYSLFVETISFQWVGVVHGKP